MSYESFYHLRELPFASTVDLMFYFETDQCKDAIARLKHAIEEGVGLGVVIGEMGMGKTTLAKRMFDEAQSPSYKPVFLTIIHRSVTASWLLKKIALQMDISSLPDEKFLLVDRIYNRLCELSDEGMKTVVFVDEANMLQSKELLEEFRVLINLELNGKKLINFIFFGLPEIDEYLKLDEHLRQRVASRIVLKPIDLQSTAGYIGYRLGIAGTNRKIFTEGAIALTHHYSRGIPRLINTLCDNALLETYLKRQGLIDEKTIEWVAVEIGLKEEKEVVFRERKPFGEILIDDKLITKTQLDKALEYQKEESITLGQALVKLDYVPKDTMIAYLKKYYKTAYL